MTARISADRLTGSWKGDYRLWLGPDVPVKQSPTRAAVSGAAADRFLVITYTWSEDEKDHDGVLLVRLVKEPGPVDMVWVDSFHTMGAFMQFAGKATTDGSVEGTTQWSVGEGPDWGWRIALSNPGENELLVRMFVATPSGEESPAVEAQYVRA